MQRLHPMQTRVAGEPTAQESTLVLPLNMKPVWVTSIVLPGWKTGIPYALIFLISIVACFQQPLSVLHPAPQNSL